MLLVLVAVVSPAQQVVKATGALRALPTETTPWRGDFDGMVERRKIRVLVAARAIVLRQMTQRPVQFEITGFGDVDRQPTARTRCAAPNRR